MEMKQTQKGKTEAIDAMEKKRERERKREEREMAKMAEAAGIKLGTSSAIGPPTSIQPAPTVGTSSGGWKKVTAMEPSIGITPANSSIQQSSPVGWKTVAAASPWKSLSKTSPVASSFQSSGFATLDTTRKAQQTPSLPFTDPPLPPPPGNEPPPLPP
jgi:hypothetical protein